MSAPTTLRRLGLYGGSFDPVHRGHLEPVEEARRLLGLDRILFVPACAPPHKSTGPSASPYHRFAMAALALQGREHFLLSDYEVSRGGTTFTVETLRHIRALTPEAEIVLVIGSDVLVSLDTWRAWREILEAHRIAVLHREPFDRERTREAVAPEIASRLAPPGATLGTAPEGATILWAGNAPVTISSTWLRRAISGGEDLKGSLPPSVEAYVLRQRLYLAP